ncbi:MAG: cupin domain-containing protein [Cyanobacteria bacterium P01_A01_bin.15]
MTNLESNAPILAYWHVWTDDYGISHQTRCKLADFSQESMGGDAAPQWNNHLFQGETTVMFAELPVGWVGEWHENPKPQWIIPLAGQWFVETMDGTRVEMGPGEASFGADQRTKPGANGHQGHLSGTVGKQPAKLMLVQLEGERWIGLKPGDWT